jgi:hypothetical protein
MGSRLIGEGTSGLLRLHESKLCTEMEHDSWGQPGKARVMEKGRLLKPQGYKDVIHTEDA